MSRFLPNFQLNTQSGTLYDIIKRNDQHYYPSSAYTAGANRIVLILPK
jgi:hypothetical protein